MSRQSAIKVEGVVSPEPVRLYSPYVVPGYVLIACAPMASRYCAEKPGNKGARTCTPAHVTRGNL